MFLTTGSKLYNVAISTRNMTLLELQDGKSKKCCVIIGAGYSLKVNENNWIVEVDPLCWVSNAKKYGEDVTVFEYFYSTNVRCMDDASKDLSDFINEELNDYDMVILHGHSKTSRDFLKIKKYIKRDINRVLVSPVFFKNQYILEKKENLVIRLVWNILFSNREVDKEITRDSSDMDEAFKSLQKGKDVVVAFTCKDYFTLNPISLFLKWVDKKMGINGDGIAPLTCQIPVQFETQILQGTHNEAIGKSTKFVKKMINNQK